ncbi:unnamed protein product [Blepharisma stoltei]|uniref:Uncharacterized protein n=1 Tax=Blepharisma stoltei TaxID=1481888 RepID=A0AAU9KAC4_9CILI|nr:unnamed protein product [Blepharisma stoltei]
MMKDIDMADVQDLYNDLSENRILDEDSSSIYQSISSINPQESQDSIKNDVNEIKKPGRKRDRDTQILSMFFTRKSKAGTPPKKEYLRCKLIRGHKRANRQIKDGVHPSKTIHKFDLANGKARDIWHTLQLHFFKNRYVLETESLTESGPTTDGKKKRGKEIIDKSTQKSFNTEYVKRYFLNEATKISFYYYVELIFADMNPDVLCDKFDFFCCKPLDHDASCTEKWTSLKIYLQKLMFEDLKLEPWRPEGESPLGGINGIPHNDLCMFNEELERVDIEKLEEIDLEDLIDSNMNYDWGDQEI